MREQKLGDELEQLTAAVDEKLEGFESRERELSAELAEALEEKRQLEEQVRRGSGRRSGAESPRVARLHQMVESVGLKQEETLEVKPPRTPSPRI